MGYIIIKINYKGDPMKILRLKKFREHHFFLDCSFATRSHRWVAFIRGIDTPAPVDNRDLPEWAEFDNGWNGSFHESEIWPERRILLAAGRTPSRARKRLKKLLRETSFESTLVDSCTHRFEMRQWVREGD